MSEKISDGGYLGLLIVGLTVCALILIIIAGMIYPFGFEMTGVKPVSTYTYDAQISATNEITDASFFIPLDSHRGVTYTGAAIADGYGYSNGNVVVDLFGTDDSAMLKVQSDRMKDASFGVSAHSPKLIDTKDAAENACIFAPADNEISNPYKVNVYAKYDCPPDTVVEISVKNTGTNEWNGLFGEKKNMFTEKVSLKLAGPHSGWTTADAYIDAGIGSYTILI